MKKIHQLVLALLMLVSTSAFAQVSSDSYEYATVASMQYANGPRLCVSYSNGDFKQIDIDKNDAKPGIAINQAPILKHLALLSKDGWEIVDFIFNPNSGSTPTYLLKRKLK